MSITIPAIESYIRENPVPVILIFFGIVLLSRVLIFNERLIERPKRRNENRSDYYRDVYLKSEEWKRKRYVVLKRDNWTCVYCGAPATQVHHKRYAKVNIGNEPIEWLVSVCNSCHQSIHSS